MALRKALHSEFLLVASAAKFICWYLGHPAYYAAVKGVKAIPHMRGPKTLGFCLMVVGVTLAKNGHHMPNFILEYSADIVGYAIHGAGAMPFLVRIEKYYKQSIDQDKES